MVTTGIPEEPIMIPGKSHFSIGRSIGQYRPLTRLLPLTVLTTLQIILPFSSKMARPIYASEAPQPGTQQNALQRILSTKVIQGFIPPEEGAPEETTTAGSRREMWCDGDRAPMRSLMPAQNYGLTFAETPTIFMEIPQTTATRALLVIQNVTVPETKGRFIAQSPEKVLEMEHA